MASDQIAQLTHQRPSLAKDQIGFHALFHRREVKLLELGDRILRKTLIAELGQRRGAPQRQCLAQQPGRVRGPARRQRVSPSLGCLGEPVEVQLTRQNLEHVAVPPRHQHPITRLALRTLVDRRRGAVGDHRAAQLGDISAQRLPSTRRRRLAPQLVDQPVRRHDLIAVQQEDRQHRPLPLAAQHQPSTAVAHLEWTEDPIVHGSGCPMREPSPPPPSARLRPGTTFAQHIVARLQPGCNRSRSASSPTKQVPDERRSR